ncbi:translation initiation factor IF-2 N-terminal domain-containing protein, partial [Synechococcus sp. MIT S9504]
MTSSGKVRIYELSKDLGLDNKDVLDAAEKLSIAAKSHSSSISEVEAGKIRTMLNSGGATRPTAAPSKPAPGKSILSVKKAAGVDASAPVKPAQPKPAPAPAAPIRAAATPQRPPARP